MSPPSHLGTSPVRTDAPAKVRGTWRYTVTLTQNLNRGASSKGEARVSVECVSEGRLRSLRWEELLQKPGAPGQPFSFR